jgi:hypothetical protein
MRMDILRRGSQRDYGTNLIVSNLSLERSLREEGNVWWDHKYKQIVIRVPWVQYGDGRTHHNYHIYLSLQDISALIMLLGHAGSADDASLLRDHLGQHVPALVKLLACATGLVPTPIVEEAAPANNQA